MAGKAVELAAALADLASELQTSSERERARRLAMLMDDPQGLALGQALTDRAHRPRSARKIVQAARAVLRSHGIPRGMMGSDRLALSLLDVLGPALPGLAARGIARRIRRETAPYLIPGQWHEFGRYMAQLKQQGLHVNINRLGEEILSQADAEHHIEAYLELLARPDVETISVKISAICSRINVLAWDETLTLLRDALRRIYRAASGETSKLVYLDMESYRDLTLNLELFQSLLDEPEFISLSAGVVLQAYIPESSTFQQKLTRWAQARVARGGAPIRLRIAKGANLGMERVESSLRNWLQPTYSNKRQVDANYKRLLEYGCQLDNASAVRLGIASHNPFDIAYGALLRAKHGSEASVGFELLQGVADPFCRALAQVFGDVLIYAPMVTERDFTSSIAYLVRRLDESSAPENFLRHSFGFGAKSSAFEKERQKFLLACLSVDEASTEPLRTQDRRNEPSPSNLSAPFRNEPDTDFSRAANRGWLAEALRTQRQFVDLPLRIASDVRSEGPTIDGFDPSRPGHVPYRHRSATRDEIMQALSAAQRGFESWRNRSPSDRAAALIRVAQGLRRMRGELIACMVSDSGKRIEEADVEVSEAIDFAEYYARSVLELETQARFEPGGVTVVAPPWNFPLAIPLGGALAALAAGNSVILKPAPETVLVAERAAHALWAADIPHDAFQLITASDEEATALITDSRVVTVILTGATSTALHFRSLRPHLHLCAETGGKNAIIVSAFADRELAIRDTLLSAFGHAGQKCSAASLLILEAEVYDDASFLEKLRSAASDLVVGSAWDPSSVVTPLIRPPGGALKRALSELDRGESWLLEPKAQTDNPLLYSPGIKLGVKEGSSSHRTEFFGPVLSVMRANDLEHALQLANGTSYGLTAGLHSLDESEQQQFLDHMNAGNLYLNRTITGAIVGRQPFGGRKGSSIGPGFKAGGPNYLLQLMREIPNEPDSSGAPTDLSDAIDSTLRSLSQDLNDTERALLQRRACDYQRAHQQFFAEPEDRFQLVGQDNWLVYQPWPTLLRVDSGFANLDLASVLLAARIASAPLHLSVASELNPLPFQSVFTTSSSALVQPAPSDVDQLDQYLTTHQVDRIRALGNTPDPLYLVTVAIPVHIARDPVSSRGRIELLHHLREQSRSITTHRYGHLGHRDPHPQKPTNR